jgi:ribonuclease HII
LKTILKSAGKVVHSAGKAAAKQRMLKLLVCSDAPEQALRYHGFQRIAGVDEVGRGALFGPVVAAAVILPERIGSLASAGLKDSKQMTREDRETMDRRIRRTALAVSVAEVAAEMIDTINIYQATRLAMLLADHLLIDALRIDHPCAQTKLFYGDALSLSIAAASVVAKVHRDALMQQLDEIHPQYGLASHKGYATPEHRRALKQHGPCPLHRRSFAPVALSDRSTLPAVPSLFSDEAGFEDAILESDKLEESVDWV